MDEILITGAAGRVGTAIRPFLRERYGLRLFDRAPVRDPEPGEHVVQGDLARSSDVRPAVEGVAGVVHLACVHGLGIGFDDTVDANYRGTVVLLDETRRAGVDRFVYASSHHVLGMHPREGFGGDGAGLAPDAFYGLSKAFGEAACSMYAHRFGIRTLTVRIGNADPGVRDERSLRMWVSGRDLADLIALGLTHPDIGYDVVYGVSECPDPLFENARARELGYRPRDRAENHLDAGYLSRTDMPPSLGGDYVGGAYAASRLPSPPERP